MILFDLVSKGEYTGPFSLRLYGHLDISELISVNISDSDMIGITDDDDSIVGYVKGEKIRFILNSLKKIPYQSIMDAFDEGVICVSPEGRIFYINDAYSKIIGVSKSRIIGNYIQAIEPGAELVRVLSTKETVIKKNVKIKSVNKNVSVFINPLFIGKNFVGAYSVFKDITEVTNLNQKVERISGVINNYALEFEAANAQGNLKIVGADPIYKQVLDRAKIVGRTDATVLITGENGVGKEVIAKLIYACSNRKDKPFVTVNCAAIPESLIESELFGYEKGSFTGADQSGKIGKFEMADEGTIFLDEIGDMPLQMQAKLLRVLENGEIEKIGRNSTTPVNVRVIAATNQSLEDLIEEKKFRKDLYYRLNVVNIRIPPLRERGHDAMLLADFFINNYNKKYNRNITMTEEVGRYVSEYNWPGNVRELQNFIESKVIMANGDKIEMDSIQPITGDDDSIKRPIHEMGEKTFEEKMLLCEEMIISDALNRHNGNRVKAIDELGISPRTFYRKMAKIKNL